ncbi:hypothetical protein Tco_0643902 [Tanacetum coccineum]
MSSPNRSTFDIEDAFSSMSIFNYTSVSSDYFPASSGSSSFNSSENSTDNIIPSVFSPFYNNPCLKNVQAFYAKELPISSPDPITPLAILTPSPEQVEDILNYLELHLYRIERMEEERTTVTTKDRTQRKSELRLQKERREKDKMCICSLQNFPILNE